MILPEWVYTMIQAVAAYEDEHAKGATCLEHALEAVPHDHHQFALALAQFRQQTPADRKDPS